MQNEQPRFLRFQYESHTYHAEVTVPYYAVTAPGRAQVYRLSREEFELACLFDGQRDAHARRAAAANLLGDSPDEQSLRLLVHDLAEANLLEAGRDEPLPPPAQLATALEDRFNEPTDEQGFPSSMQRGSLAAPGGEGPLIGAPSGERGAPHAPRWRLPTLLLTWLGHVFNLTLYLRLSFLPIGLALAALYGLWINRFDAGVDSLRLLWLPLLLVTVAASVVLVNLISQIARAAAIAHYTDEKPHFGIGLAFGFIPRFLTATEGPAERASPKARMRIVASSLHATLWLFVLAVIGWFTARHTGTTLPALWLGLAAVALTTFLIRLNPLVRRDGYFLLAHSLRTPDLREQAFLALFGYDRPWRDRLPPRSGPLQLYAVAVVAYVALVITMIVLFPGHWLENFWGGTGVLIFLALIALIIWEQSKRVRAGRGRIEIYRLSMPHFPRWAWLVFILLALLALFPYTYSPSGAATVLPAHRADIRAVTSGGIATINAREGEVVTAGENILSLDDDQQQAQLQSAKAKLKELQANLANIKAGSGNEKIALEKQNVATAKKRYQYSSAEAERLRKAYRQNAVSRQAYQTAEGKASVQREQLEAARKQLDIATASPRAKSLEAKQASIDAQMARVEYFQQELDKTRIKAPISGQIVSAQLMYAQGDYLHEGDLIATVEDDRQLFAELRMPEATIGEVQSGALSKVKLWAFPGTSFAGHVTRIAPNAETSKYGKIVRVMVAINDPDNQLKPGMTGQAKVRGGVYPAIVVYTRALARFLLIEVWSWLP